MGLRCEAMPWRRRRLCLEPSIPTLPMRFLLATALLLSTPLLAQRLPEVEPNNTAATEQAVAMGVQIDAALVAADNDWYSITSVGGQVRFTTSGVADTRLEISGPTGLPVLAGNDDSRALQSDITIDLLAGSYKVRVFGFSATTAGAYSLDIALETPAKTFTAVEVEPNNTLLLAQPIGIDAQVNGSLAPLDEDWYRIVLTAPRTGLFIQVTEGDAPWVSQHSIEFYDVAGVCCRRRPSVSMPSTPVRSASARPRPVSGPRAPTTSWSRTAPRLRVTTPCRSATTVSRSSRCR